MKKIIYRTAALLLAGILLCGLGFPVLAVSAPDLTVKGSVRLELKDTEGRVEEGGSVTLYRAASVKSGGSGLYWEYTDAFSGCGSSLESADLEGLAADLAAYARQKKIEGVTKTAGKDGIISFEELSVGLYLCVQEKTAEGWEAFLPFLISLPQENEEGYLYHIDASPKLELNRETDRKPPESPAPPKKSPGSSSPKPSVLPQTGQLWWPVPLLACAGLALFLVGWLRRGGRNEE